MARMIVNVLVICQIFVFIDGTHNTTVFVEPVEPGAHFRELGGSLTRIVGGEPTNIKDYPFAVSVQWRLGSKHHCGGSYIVPKFVLSAAHCMVRYSYQNWRPQNPRYFVIVAGSTNLWYTPSWQISNTDAVMPHPRFMYDSMANDIGLFKLNKEFRITAYVNFVPLPYGVDKDLFKKKNQTCTVIGWGKTSESSATTSDVLRHVDVPLISTRECSRYYTGGLHRSQICAGRKEGGVDACQGDSGGPLLCNKIQVGIVSWGSGCAAPNYPGVYTRVDHYLNWIKSTVLRNSASFNDHYDSLSIILMSYFFNSFVYTIIFDKP